GKTEHSAWRRAKASLHHPNAGTTPSTVTRTAAQRPPPPEWRVSSDNSIQATFPSTLSKTSTAVGDVHPCPTPSCYRMFSTIAASMNVSSCYLTDAVLNTVPGPNIMSGSTVTLYPQLLPACSQARAPILTPPAS